MAALPQPDRPLRIALFGGTFDPPHRAHVAIARAAADHFALDTVFFAPAGRQPLKPAGATTPFADRLTLCALACGEDPRFAVSNLDAPRPDAQPNYTVRTLGLLQELMPRAQLFAIAGADSFHTLGRWREPERLLALAEWIVVSRPGSPLRPPAGMELTPAQLQRIHLLDAVQDDLSATRLRERLEVGEDCTALLPLAVAKWIATHNPYRR